MEFLVIQDKIVGTFINTETMESWEPMNLNTLNIIIGIGFMIILIVMNVGGVLKTSLM